MIDGESWVGGRDSDDLESDSGGSLWVICGRFG